VAIIFNDLSVVAARLLWVFNLLSNIFALDGGLDGAAYCYICRNFRGNFR